MSEPASKLGEVPWIFGEYNVVEEADVIDLGDPRPIPESTDCGLFPMLDMAATATAVGACSTVEVEFPEIRLWEG